MTRLLFTGFPGFLGSALLPRMLAARPGAEALCLVQRRWVGRARDRVRRIEARRPELEGRIHLVEGDLIEPGLGIDDADALEGVTEVAHLAAVYDLDVDRDTAVRVNRDGTVRVLRLCEELPSLRRLHYVSTCYVSGRHPGVFSEEDLDVGQSFNNFYEETKFLAELEVRRAMEGGLPATVYRPAAVVGDAATGATQKYDGPYFVIRLLLRQPRVALLPVPGDPRRHSVNVVPRDWLVDAIARLSTRPDAEGRTYNLADPDPPTIDGMIGILADATRRRVVRIPLPIGLARWATRHLPGVRAITGIPAGALGYFVHPTTYATDRTQAALAGFAPPPFREYAPTLVDFVRANPEPAAGPMT